MIKKIFIIAGEASGDLHAANLIKELYSQNPTLQIQAWGGDKMKLAGANILKHIKDLAFMGFVEVIKHLPTIAQNFKLCKKQINSFDPDIIIFIDYPGFNLRLAKWSKENGFLNAYYISPQIWAWKENRIHKIKKYIDKMICILPFEVDFYKSHNLDIVYVGHPLLEAISPFKTNTSKLNQIALLPGSRLQEIKKNLPTMLAITPSFQNYKFIIAQSPTLDKQVYIPFLKDYPNIKLIQNQTYQILNSSSAALVASGTATLETALFNVPQIVCFKASPLSVAIARKLIKVKYISLVNLILNKYAIDELIQNEFNKTQLTQKLNILLNKNNPITIQLFKEYENLNQKLLQSHTASYLTASEILKMIDKNTPKNTSF